MRVVEINGGVYGSTGKIMFGIAKAAEESGMEVMCASPITSTNRNQEPEEDYIKIGNYLGRKMSVLAARITGYSGCFSWLATRSFLKKLDEINPEIIHLHTLHDSYINLPMLFRYIKRRNIRVIWTFHDCWPFTGKCPHFVTKDCMRWKAECGECPCKGEYPASYTDNSKKMLRLKKKWFVGVKDLTIVTPSKWLADFIPESFLNGYTTQIINNGINLSVFKPTKSDFRKDHGIENRYIVLGVAFGWGYKKGLDVFIELAELLSDDYQIVLVGTDDSVDEMIPSNIISVHRTQNEKELAGLYTTADVFVNPTREDTYPTVNMEAVACGTPVVTFDVGGSPEIIIEDIGYVIEDRNINMMKTAIERVVKLKDPLSNACLKYAKIFDEQKTFSKYISLYNEV